MPIADIGDLVYNTVVFTSLHKSKMTATPVYSESGRVVKWIEYNLTVDAWIGGSIDTGAELEDKRILLMQPAKTLTFLGYGFGNLAVNRLGPPTDVAWGPKPKLLSWRPIGGAQGCEISWQVEFRIPECSGKTRYGDIITIEYDIEIDVDVDGYSTRTISGYLEIGQTRQPNSNKVKTTADNYYEEAFPANIKGFQRTVRHRKLSKDRNRLDFNFTDKELPVPLPEKMTTIQIEQTLSSRMAKGYSFVTWDLRFSGSATTPAGRSKQDTINACLAVVQSKIRNLKLAGNTNVLNEVITVKNASKLLCILPDSCSFSDQLLGSGIRFDLSYKLIAAIGISRAIAASRMYLPNDGLDYDKWAKSNASGPAHPRGVAGMIVLGGEALIDLCLPYPPAPTESTSVLTGKLPPRKISPTSNSPESNPVDPEASWMIYQNGLEVFTKNRVARHKRLPAEDPRRYAVLSGALDPTRAVDPITNQVANKIPEPKAQQDDVIQELGPPSYLVRMAGYAERVGHPIPLPRLISINGVPVTQVGGNGKSERTRAVGAVPLYEAYWSFLYALPRKFDGVVPDLANPWIDKDGGQVT